MTSETSKSVKAILSWAIFAVLLVSTTASVAANTPEIRSPVTDRADVISELVEAQLGDALRAHFEQTGVQMAVLTVPTTDGEPIEDFAFRVANEWGGGRAGEDRGILLTLSIDDRRSRLEVGYGLEGVYPDIRAARTLAEIRPQLRANDYDAAVQAVVDEVLDGTDHLEPGRRAGLFDIHPLWNGAVGMLLMALLGLLMVGVPAVAGAEEWVSWSQTQTVWVSLVLFSIGAGWTFWVAQDIAPLGYLAMYVGGAIGGVIVAVADGMHRIAPLAAIFVILCFVSFVPEFNGGMPPDADGKMLIVAISYAALALVPHSSTWDTSTGVRRRDDDGGFSSSSGGGSSGGGGYSGGGGSFGGGGASGSW